jgi:carbonic anhydrase
VTCWPEAASLRPCHLVVGLVLVCLVSACAPAPGDVASTGDAGAPTTEVPEFHYDGEAGPEHWGELSEAWATCADGSMQSPIDIADPEPADLDPIELDYAAADATAHDTGHTIQVDVAPGSTMVLEGTSYDLVQMHFHAPSEHVIGGETAAAEMHFVHRADDESLAVLGVLVEEGDATDAWDPVLDAIGEAGPEDGDAVDLPDLDPSSLLPGERTSIRYEGSLTTPPCSEGVRWSVLTEALELSAAQIGALTDRYEGNARPAQPLRDREILSDSDPDADGT